MTEVDYITVGAGTAGNTNAPVVMIGEKAADMIGTDAALH